MHYARHVRDVHRQWRPYLCDLCGKAFKRPDALKQHKYLLNVYQLYLRNISNFKFFYKKSLLHSKPEKDGSFPFQCLIKSCLKKCHSRAHLKGKV